MGKTPAMLWLREPSWWSAPHHWQRLWMDGNKSAWLIRDTTVQTVSRISHANTTDWEEENSSQVLLALKTIDRALAMGLSLRAKQNKCGENNAWYSWHVRTLGAWAASDNNSVYFLPVAAGLKGLLPDMKKSRPQCSDDKGIMIDSCVARLLEYKPEEHELIIEHFIYREPLRAIAKKRKCSDGTIRKELQTALGFV